MLQQYLDKQEQKVEYRMCQFHCDVHNKNKCLNFYLKSKSCIINLFHLFFYWFFSKKKFVKKKKLERNHPLIS